MKTFCDFCGAEIRRRKQLEDHSNHFCDAQCKGLWRTERSKTNDPNRRRRIKHCLEFIYKKVEKT